MSFLPINEENKEAPAGQTTNAPGGAPPPQTSGSAGAAPEAPKGASSGSPTQFGSSASKLGDYLSANAPQITQQAENITGQLNQRYGDVSQGITNAANQFGQQVQGGYAAPNQDLVSQAAQNPVDFAANPENVQAFQKQYNNAYTGPLNFEGTSPYSDIQNQVGQAVQQGNLLGSEAGLQTYLQGQGTNPSRASATLDTLLLRGNPEAQSKIRAAAGQLGTLGEQLQTATQGANALIAPAQQQAQQSQEQARNLFTGQTGVVPKWESDLSARVKAAQDQLQAYNQAVSGTRQQVGSVLPSINSLSNIIAAMGQKPVSIDTSNLREMTSPAMPGTVASGQDYAMQAALQQLLGDVSNAPLDPAQVNFAGSFQAPSGAIATPESYIRPALVDLINKQYAATFPNGPNQRGEPTIPDWAPQMYALYDYLNSNVPGIVQQANNGNFSGYELADPSGLTHIDVDPKFGNSGYSGPISSSAYKPIEKRG